MAFQTRKVIKFSEMLLSVHAEVNELLEGSGECLWCFVGRLLTERSDWAKAANDAERSLLRVLHSIWKCNVDRHLPSISFKSVSLSDPMRLSVGLGPVSGTNRIEGKKNNHFYLINSRCSNDREDIKSTILHGRGGM